MCVSFALIFLIDSKRNASQIRSVRTACMIDNRYRCSCNDMHLWNSYIAPSCIHVMQISPSSIDPDLMYSKFSLEARIKRLYKKNGSQQRFIFHAFLMSSLSHPLLSLFLFAFQYMLLHFRECFATRKNGRSGFYKNASYMLRLL